MWKATMRSQRNQMGLKSYLSCFQVKKPGVSLLNIVYTRTLQEHKYITRGWFGILQISHTLVVTAVIRKG